MVSKDLCGLYRALISNSSEDAELEMSRIRNDVDEMIFVKHFFRFLAAVRSTPPKIEKNAKFVRRIVRSFVESYVRSFVRSFVRSPN